MALVPHFSSLHNVETLSPWCLTAYCGVSENINYKPCCRNLCDCKLTAIKDINCHNARAMECVVQRLHSAPLYYGHTIECMLIFTTHLMFTSRKVAVSAVKFDPAISIHDSSQFTYPIGEYSRLYVCFTFCLTKTGLHGIPASFLHVSIPIAALINLLLSTSVVHMWWKSAS
jgi:hypothetical protein